MKYSKYMGAAFLGAQLLFFFGCAGKTENRISEKKSVSMDWRLNPGSTVLNLRKQFFITGEKLDSVEISHGPSLQLEKFELSGGAGKMRVFITVRPLAEFPDSAGADKPGYRELRLKTADGKIKTLGLQLVDEDPDKSGKELKLRVD